VVLSDDGRWLLVVNAGSDELSLFAVQPDGLQLADRAGSGGSNPTRSPSAEDAGLPVLTM
jgi:6-phosphogluconolactonase (cycloisomerase 2 family)